MAVMRMDWVEASGTGGSLVEAPGTVAGPLLLGWVGESVRWRCCGGGGGPNERKKENERASTRTAGLTRPICQPANQPVDGGYKVRYLGRYRDGYLKQGLLRCGLMYHGMYPGTSCTVPAGSAITWGHAALRSRPTRYQMYCTSAGRPELPVAVAWVHQRPGANCSAGTSSNYVFGTVLAGCDRRIASGASSQCQPHRASLSQPIPEGLEGGQLLTPGSLGWYLRVACSRVSSLVPAKH